MHPTELLPDAQTVIAFVFPFAKSVITANRESPQIVREWAVAYIETNKLIATISAEQKRELITLGINVVTQPTTHNFNEQDLTARWSIKSIAYVAGLGTFGINHMLITPSGCGGRFGSTIISADIPSTSRPTLEDCSYISDSKCQFCVNNCPTELCRPRPGRT